METYKIGDYIGKDFKIYKILGGEGQSGMGIVYVCYNEQYQTVYALKTFQDKFMNNLEIKNAFKREALAWISLERHPYIVRAYFVQELDGRLFIVLEYIAPDKENRNTLTDYLLKPLSLKQTLEWGIQFCYGMEHAAAIGVSPHRDIKPDNIMITQNKILKITDFGLAGILELSTYHQDIDLDKNHLSFMRLANGREAAGTPPYMATEQFEGYADERSDIYSFGIVLYQMTARGSLPFIGRTIAEWQHLHQKAEVPWLESPLMPVIKRCLQKRPEERYASFAELRNDLERLYLEENNGQPFEKPTIDTLEAWEYFNKGNSLNTLGMTNEAIDAYRRALEINPEFAKAYYNLGNALADSGQLKEAIEAFRKALEINPKFAEAYNNLGLALSNSHQLQEAIEAYRKALKINPDDAEVYTNLGVALADTGQLKEAIEAYRRALKINPKDAQAHNNLGNALFNLGRLKEAIEAYYKALEINPKDAQAYYNLGIDLVKSGQLKEAIEAFQNFIEYAPFVYAQYVEQVHQIIQDLKQRIGQ